MIHFKDRTFCIASMVEGCGNNECERNMTKALDEESERAGLPIAAASFRTETCGYVQRDDSTTPKGN
jgi:hypothetical protein